MAWSVLGAFAAGGSAAYVCNHTDICRRVFTDFESTLSKAQTVSRQDYDRLVLKLLESKPSSTVVVRDSSSSGKWILIPCVGGGAWVVYWVFVRGHKFSDLFYVTRAGFKSAFDKLKGGIVHVEGEIKKVAENFQQHFRKLDNKVEESLVKHDATNAQLQELQQSSTCALEQLQHVQGNMMDLTGLVRMLKSQQDHGNEGIRLLCNMLLAMMCARGGAGNRGPSREIESIISRLRLYVEQDSASANGPFKLTDEEWSLLTAFDQPKQLQPAQPTAASLQHASSSPTIDTTCLPSPSSSSSAAPTPSSNSARRGLMGSFGFRSFLTTAASSSAVVPPHDGVERSDSVLHQPSFPSDIKDGNVTNVAAAADLFSD